MTDALGLLAATLTTLAFLPQAVKTWRTGATRDISPVTFTALCTGIACWLAYGLLIDDVAIIVANAVTLPLAGSILAMTLRDRLRGAPPAEPSSDA